MLTGQEILQLKLMSYKNKGKTYIRAYRNKWVPATPEEAEKGSKGRSVPDVQIQVGVLQPDSRVQMGKKFLTLHPEFSNQWVLQGKMVRFSPKVERLATDIAHH